MANTYVEKGCLVDTCNGKHEGFEYCPKHYSKFRRHGVAFGPFIGRNPNMCTVDGCDKRGPIYGLCHKHNKWKKRTGDPTIRPPKKEYVLPSQKNKPAKYKYIVVNNHPLLGTGCYKEHRVVMTDSLGRKLLPSENVHHINGDRMDNRIENLELWIISQPSGQRLEDKVQWAMELLRQYKPEVLKEGV